MKKELILLDYKALVPKDKKFYVLMELNKLVMQEIKIMISGGYAFGGGK
jgi:hypothetical protein